MDHDDQHDAHLTAAYRRMVRRRHASPTVPTVADGTPYVPAVPIRTANRLKGRCPICAKRLTVRAYQPGPEVYRPPTATPAADLRVLSCAGGCQSRDIHARACGWSPDGIAGTPTVTPPPASAADKRDPEYRPPIDWRFHEA